MSRIMIRYVVAVLIAYTLSLALLFLMAWLNRNEARLFGGLNQVIEVVAQRRSGSGMAIDATNGVTVSIAENFPAVDSLLEEKRYSFCLKIPETDDLVVIQMDDGKFATAIAEEDRNFLLFSLTSMLIFATVGAVLSLPFVRQLKKQELVIQRLADGDLTARMSLCDKDTLGRLGQRIDLMAERLEKLVGGHKEVLRTVSHELRTPMNRSYFLLELMESDCSSMPTVIQSRMRSLRENLTEQDSLIEELLVYSRLDVVPDLKVHDVTLEILVKRLFDKEAELFSDIDLTYEISEFNCRVKGDEHLLARVVANLANNAFKHAKHAVAVELTSSPQHVELLISNDGDAIDNGDCKKIFEPFVQLGEGPGMGLGLAICKKIIELHGGEIAIYSAASRRTTCRVLLFRECESTLGI